MNKDDNVVAGAQSGEMLSRVTADPHDFVKGSVLLPKMVPADLLAKRKLTKVGS